MRVNTRTTVLAIVAMTAVSFQTARAQNSGAAALDPQAKKVLNDVGDALMMLRGGAHEDVIGQQEIWATGMAGTALVKSYHAAVNFKVPGIRVDMTRTPGGRTIQVVSGKYAWNESQPGAGLDNEGTATPAMTTVNDRLLQIWMLPHGVWKAAAAAGAQTKIGKEGGKTTITYPAAGTTVKATLNAKNLIEKVEARSDNPATAVVTTYAMYGDWNDANLPVAKRAFSDVQFPKTIVQKQGGRTVLSLTIVRTDTNNPYVVMPVPDGVQKAAGPQR